MRAVAPWMAAVLLLTPLAAALPAEGERRIASGLATPVELAFRADGGLLYAELASGAVRLLRDEGAAPSTVASVRASGGGNGGFTGLATDPADPRTLYVVYSFEKAGAVHGKVNRVSKLVDGAETVLLDDIPWAQFHDGGRVAVGMDGFLYVTTGDNGDDQRQPGSHPGDPAQDPQSLKGKVLRLSKDGAPAGGVAGWNPYVRAMGFRNPFGLAVGPDGTVYVAENGIHHDEVNVLVQGADYGWPACDGDCAGYRNPLATWPDSFGTTGLAYLGGKLYVGDYTGKRLRVVDPATGTTAVSWATGGGAVLGVAAGPDRCLYVSTPNAIHQVDVADTGACDLQAQGAPPPTPAPPPPSPTPPVTSPPASTPPAPPPPPPPPPVPPSPPAPREPPAPTPPPPETPPPPASPPPSTEVPPAPTVPVESTEPPVPLDATPVVTDGTQESSAARDTPGAGLPGTAGAVALAGIVLRRRGGRWRARKP